MPNEPKPPSDSLRSIAEKLAGSRSIADEITRTLKSSSVSIPDSLLRMPVIDIPRMPTPKEQNSFQSSGVLVKRMAQTVTQWRAQVPADSQPVVLALLQGGVQINVSLLAEESFHALRIEGTIDGSPCMLLTHQASVQLLCFVAKVEQESQRRQIGFIIDGKQTSA